MTRSTSTLDDSTLVQRLRNSFAAHADLPALAGAGAPLTYRELERQSAAVAYALAQAGVRAGHIVPLVMRRSVELVVVQLALVRLGAAYAPIDLASPLHRQQAMLATLRPSHIVSDDSAAVHATAVVLDVTKVHKLVDASFAPWHVTDACVPACVMFTSGTTGTPKAVQVPGAGIVRLVCDADFADFRLGARWAFLSSPAFDASTLEVWAPLLNGGCCVVQEGALPSLDELADFLLTNSVTDTWITAALFNTLVDDRLDAFANLRQLLTGGERVSPRHAQAVLREYPELRLINGYGPTENTTFTLCRTITWADTENPSGIPIGRPIRGTVVRVGTSHETDDEGELLAGGEGVALGYLNDTEQTLRKFIEVDGRRWYRTGDMVNRRADGGFDFRGRVDRQVKIQGHRVELDEVESVLGSCPGVSEASVLVRGDTAESRHLVAFYSCVGRPPPPAASVAGFLRERLPPSSVPSRLVPLERMPLNMNGKLDRSALGLLFDQRVCSSHDTDWQTDTERQLADIWQRCFPSASVHRQASFFALGGSSLLATQVSAQVRREIGRDLKPIDVLRVPLLAEQARCVDSSAPFDVNAWAGEPTLDDRLPLTEGQQSILLASQLDASGCAWLVHVPLLLHAMPDRDVLRCAFQALAARHPALRMAMRAEASPTHARVCVELADGWWCEHAPLAHAPTDLAWPAALLSAVNRPLDLDGCGVMRVDVWPVRDGSCLVVWTVHHVAIDDASIERSLQELDHLLARKELSPVYGSPLGFAPLERAWTDHEAIRTWSQVLIEALAGQPMPLEHAPAAGREVQLPMPLALNARLRGACRCWGVTPFAPLLTAYGLALQDVFGPSYRFVSTPFSRRIEPELIEPVGYFVDLCIVEAGARPGETSAQTLARVNQDVLGLQRAAFLPRRALLDDIGKSDAAVARHMNAFSFTWRLDPARAVRLGAQNAQLLRAPQRSARYGLALHMASLLGEMSCSLEAVEGAFKDGRVDALAQAFFTRLSELCEIAELPSPRATSSPEIDPRQTALSSDVEVALRSTWERWLGVPADSIKPSSDFLQSGGNSLTVMRMAAQLRRDFGLTVDAGAFLGRPTFRNLCALAGALPIHNLNGCVYVGQSNAPKVLLLIPGQGGHALGLYRLAEHLQKRLGEDHVAVIMDLESMLLHSPSLRPLWFLRERMGQLIKELGPQRIVGLVGFSLGGLLALHLARHFPEDHNAPPVWLLDTYAPRTLVLRSLYRRIERRLARALLAPKEGAHTRDAQAEDDCATRLSGASIMSAPMWAVLQKQLSHQACDAPGVEVHLVQAQHSVHHVGLLWRRSSNGFNRRQYGHWHLHGIDAMHLDLPRTLAAQTADLFTAGVQWSTRAVPAT